MIVKQVAAVPNGYQQLTVSSTAVGLTVPTGTHIAIIVLEDAGVRYRDDGTNPTSSIGTPLLQDQSVEVIGSKALSALKLIRSGGSDAKINVNYYKQ